MVAMATTILIRKCWSELFWRHTQDITSEMGEARTYSHKHHHQQTARRVRCWKHMTLSYWQNISPIRSLNPQILDIVDCTQLGCSNLCTQQGKPSSDDSIKNFIHGKLKRTLFSSPTIHIQKTLLKSVMVNSSTFRGVGGLNKPNEL